MTENDSEITVERLQEIIELLRDFEPETPEEIILIVQELVKESCGRIAAPSLFPTG